MTFLRQDRPVHDLAHDPGPDYAFVQQNTAVKPDCYEPLGDAHPSAWSAGGVISSPDRPSSTIVDLGLAYQEGEQCQVRSQR